MRQSSAFVTATDAFGTASHFAAVNRWALDAISLLRLRMGNSLPDKCSQTGGLKLAQEN